MQLIINHQEATTFVESHFNVRPKFVTIDNKTLEVSYNHSVLMPATVVRFHLETVSEFAVCMSYDSNFITSLLIVGAVLGKKLPSGIEVDSANRRVNIYLPHFKPMSKILEYVVLCDIMFEEDATNLTLKQRCK